MKKIKKIVALVAIAISCGLTFVGCDFAEQGLISGNGTVENSVTLENFTDEEKIVLLDSAFVLPSDSVKDENGTEYAVEYSVRTKSGKEIDAIDNVVWIKNFETYYVTCQAVVGESDVRSRTITLTVKDESAPIITFGEISDGYEGEEYLLPTIEVSDSSGGTITPEVKIYLLDGDEKEEEIYFKGDSFTPNVAGYYLIEATAEDGSENVAKASEVLNIRPQTAKTTILSFDSEVDADKIIKTKNKTIAWFPEFAGQRNVVQVSYTGNMWESQFAYLPMQDVSLDTSTLFSKYDSAIVRMYIVSTEEVCNVWDRITFRNGNGADEILYETAYNQWVDYRFSSSVLKDGQFTDVAKLHGRCDSVTASAKGVFYLAGIFVANEATVSVANIQNTKEMRVSAKDGEGKELDLTKAIVRVVSPEGTVKIVKDGKFTLNTNGRYSVYVETQDGFWGKAIYSTDTAEILSFDEEEDVRCYVQRKNPLVKEWISEFQGERGVMKITYTGGEQYTPHFTINLPMRDIHQITDYTHVIVRMYVVETETVKNVWNTVYMQTTSNPSSVAYESNKWVDYKFTLAQMKTGNTNTVKILGNAGALSYSAYDKTAPERTGEFYVAGVFLVKD